MSVVSISLPSDGSTADVADYNTPITVLVNDYNGNIDNSNIAAAAAIAGSKLADDSITDGKIVGIDKSNLTTDSNPYKFSVSRAAAAATGSGAFAKIVWDTEAFDTNSNFATGTYTAPVAGFYQFNAYINVIAGTTNIISLYKNGAEFRRGGQISTAGGISVSVLVELAATNTVDIYAFGNAANSLDVTAGLNYFTGCLISRT